MNISELLHRLLFESFIDIRFYAYGEDANQAFQIAEYDASTALRSLSSFDRHSYL